ncbi:MAG: hypothetical protein ACOCWG_06000 [bacterium]
MYALNSLLEHQQLVISNLRDNEEYFKKEIFKSLKWLDDNEAFQLYIWLNENFFDSHGEIISEVFEKMSLAQKKESFEYVHENEEKFTLA